MVEAATPYPLCWPAQRPRRAPGSRKQGRFNSRERRGGMSYSTAEPLSVSAALRRLQDELDRIGAHYAVISSNLETRLDGLPRAGQRKPADPGVALYFQLARKPHCLPCDTYQRVADNIAAIAAHIEATRAIERHGVASIAEMFAGFLALPSPDQTRPWRAVLELHRETRISPVAIEEAYRRLARERHPDQGGSDSMMAELNAARDAAKREMAEGRDG